MEDFVVEANGYCFFCLEKCSSQISSRVKSGSAHSLEYLSRYLKMNRRKIFNDEESIPPDLLAKVEKSRLTSDLCAECGRLNKQFSKLFRNFEKTELNIASCLNLIHKRLLAAEDTGKSEKFSNDVQSEPAANAKRKIVQALRGEAMDNCSKKFNGKAPRVKLRNLKAKEIYQRKLNLKSTSHIRIPRHESALNVPFDEPKNKINGVKKELHISSSNQQYDEENDEGHDDMASDNFTTVEDGTEAETYEQLEGKDAAIEDGSLSMSNSVPVPNNPLQMKISYEGTFTISKTGKFVCTDCSREYTDRSNFNKHYRGAHLKLKFRCLPCGKDFSQRVHFNNHQVSVHQRVRFKCDCCDGMYTSKANLDSHRRSAHFGGRFPCNFCPMTFANYKERNTHMKVECQ